MASKTFGGTTLGELREFFINAQTGDTLLIPNDVVDGSDLPGGTWVTARVQDNIKIVGAKTGGKVRIGGASSDPTNFALNLPLLRSVKGNLTEVPDEPIDGITIENIHLNVDITSFYYTPGGTGPMYNTVRIGGFIQLARNVRIKDCEASGRIDPNIPDNISQIGGFVGGISEGSSNSTFTNCVNRCDIKVVAFGVGGIVGFDENSPIQFKNCVNYAHIQADRYVGGIAGDLSLQHGGKAELLDCINHGAINNVSTQGTHEIAGICGGVLFATEMIVTGCSNDGNISGIREVSGLIAQAQLLYEHSPGLIKDCSNNAIIQCQSEGAAGLIAICSNNIVFENCHNAGSVEQGIDSSYDPNTFSGGYAGGIVGTGNISAIMHCTNDATVTSHGIPMTGGIAGSVFADYVGGGEIAYCINRADIAGYSLIGGIVGTAAGQDDTVPLLIHDCLNRGAVTTAYFESSPTFRPDDVGGIVGQVNNSVTIRDCVTCGSLRPGTSGGVSAVNGSQVGGIVGNVYCWQDRSSTASVTTKIHNNYSAVAFVSGVGAVHRILGAFNAAVPPDIGGALELYDNYAYGGMRVTGNNQQYIGQIGVDSNDAPIYGDITAYSYDYDHFITPLQSGGVYSDSIIPKDAPDYGLNRYDGSNLIRLGECSDYWGITATKTRVKYCGCGRVMKAGMFKVCICSSDGTFLGDVTNDINGDFDISPILVTHPGTYCARISMAGNSECPYIYYDPFPEYVQFVATLGADGKLTTKVRYPNGKGGFINMYMGI
ncbi:hypothetical protein FACS1894184_20040 [Clostridia bacterium]|nr:hypothetical protein FACS1894184_20040 [Clostridia bacterium]